MTVGEGELRRPKNSEAGGGARKGDVEFGARRGIGAEPRKGGGARRGNGCRKRRDKQMRRRQLGQGGAKSGEGSFLIWDENERISLAEANFFTGGSRVILRPKTSNLVHIWVLRITVELTSYSITC